MKNWIIIVAVVLLGAVAYYYFQVYQPPEPESPVVTPVAVVEPQPEPEPVQAPGPEPMPVVTPPEYEEIPLPMLADSDPVILESMGDLIGAPAATRYLAGDNVISRLVATIDALGSHQIPGAIQAVQPPDGTFLAAPDDQPEEVVRNDAGDVIPQFTLDPANYERYTPFVELLESADTAGLVDSYHRNYSLIQEAFRMQGYADGVFNDRLLEIIDQLLATPEVSDPVALMKPEAYYLFVDPELEALNAGQKILLRMGPSNAARVKSRLVEIRAQLE